MKRGKFIVFEGINGCGKGTQIVRFAEEILKDRSKTVFLTREPNEFDGYGKEARRILNSDGDPYLNQLEALNYFSLSRINHNSIFQPMLERGIDVNSDRYYHSTFAFQGAQGIPFNKIAHHNKDPRIRIPDLTCIIDISVEEAFSRLGKRSDDRRKFDRDFAFMEKVRENYLILPENLPKLMNDKSIVIINGSGSVKEVFDRIMVEYHKNFSS